MYYNVNTINGKSRHLFPIPLNSKISEVEVYVTFRNEVQIVRQKLNTCRWFWLQTNEMPDELLIAEMSDTGNSYQRIKPLNLSRENLLGFLHQLSLKI